MSPQFRDERVLLFCSEKCKDEYIEGKLKRIKSNYPEYYDEIKKNPKKNPFESHLMKMGDKKEGRRVK